MATFEIQAPDGSVYQIDGQTEAGAVAALKKHLQVEEQPKASRAQAQFDAAPFYAKPFMAANDLARIAGDTLSGGYGDKFAAYSPFSTALCLSGQGRKIARRLGLEVEACAFKSELRGDHRRGEGQYGDNGASPGHDPPRP